MNKQKIFTQVSAGIFGGTICGMIGFFKMLSLGSGEGGCWPFIDSIFNTAGYESCGSFGAISGIISGSIVGIIIFSLLKISNYKKISLSLIFSALFAPLIYNLIIFLSKSLSGDIFVVLFLTLIFFFFSIIPSLFFAVLLNLRKIITKER